MNNPTTRPTLVGRVRMKDSRPLGRLVKLEIASFLIILAAGLIPAHSQQQASICLAVTTIVNGLATTSCIPVSAANPLPISLIGGGGSTLTAGTTPTAGFTAGQLMMSDGSLLQPAAAGQAAAIVSNGTQPTITGAGGTCATSTKVGGATAGTVVLSGVCIGTNTITWTGMPTVPNGYVCDAVDRTNRTSGPFPQSASTTTGFTITLGPTSSVAADVLQWKCIGY
jgi:hypothetical protein